MDKMLAITILLSRCLDVGINKLPNNANDSEQAYGYGVELAGATQGCNV